MANMFSSTSPTSASPTTSLTTTNFPRARRASDLDPFALHRDPHDDPFASSPTSSDGGFNVKGRRESEPDPTPMSQRDRRLSKEWDASKVPPSRFQKLEGSIMATPASRDGHVARNKLKMVVEKAKDKTHKK